MGAHWKGLEGLVLTTRLLPPLLHGKPLAPVVLEAMGLDAPIGPLPPLPLQVRNLDV